MLEETVVFEADTAYASKDGASHEMIRIRAEPIDDIVVVPDVDLRYLRIRRSERLGAIPSNVVVEVIFVAVFPHALIKWVVSSFGGIGNPRPLFQWPIHANSIVVDLVTTADHDMEGFLMVDSQDIIPQHRALQGNMLGLTKQQTCASSGLT